MLVPTVPTFVMGDASVTKLQQLSLCVTWLANAQASPMWHLYRTATASIGASTWTTIPMSYASLDTDGVWSGSVSVVINTQGYYATEACVPFQTTATATQCKASFLWTAGTNNAHYTSGTTLRYGLRSGFSVAATSADETLCPDDICPVVCYPGDTIVLQAYAGAAMTIDQDNGGGVNGVQARLVCNFTGHWIRTGS